MNVEGLIGTSRYIQSVRVIDGIWDAIFDYGDWLRSDPGFRKLARSLLLEPRSINRGYFKRQALEGIFAQHDAETSSYYGSHIWNLMMLELWHRHHMDVRP